MLNPFARLLAVFERRWLINYIAREIYHETLSWTQEPTIPHAGLLLQKRLRIHGIELSELSAYEQMRRMMRGY